MQNVAKVIITLKSLFNYVKKLYKSKKKHKKHPWFNLPHKNDALWEWGGKAPLRLSREHGKEHLAIIINSKTCNLQYKKIYMWNCTFLTQFG